MKRNPKPSIPGTVVAHWGPNPRTKPTTGNLGPRDPGPHGKTLEQGRNQSSAVLTKALRRIGFNAQETPRG